MHIDLYSETAVYYVANILFIEIVVRLPRYFRWSDKRKFDRIEGRFKKGENRLSENLIIN